ncbi:MAG: alkaline phosphatase PhoX [Pseudomonadota bacterium]|nr:MAG: phosphatase [Rhodocyclales bacterium GWA2_65_19]
MQKKYLNIAVAGALAAMSVGAHAADTYFDNFTPLAASAGTTATPATPITLSSPNFSQVSLADRTTQNAKAAGSNSGSWDMITANETGTNAGRYLFMPFETNTGGVQRVDLWDNNYNTRTVTIVAPGSQGFVSGDASRWTPWGSYLTAEESWGTGSTKGRLFEVTNSTTAAANGGNFVQRNIIPRVSHEGLAFDKQNTMYFIDELNGGSVYKYVSNNANATNGDDYFASGQSFVMRVGDGSAFGGTGAASWVALTDTNGAALAGVVMTSYGAVDGRATADLGRAGNLGSEATNPTTSFLGTEYNRPEDLETKTLANGNEGIFFATTDSQQVFMMELDSAGNTAVKLFVDRNTIDLATGVAVGSALTSPDNLAIDAAGNIYIIEDRNGGVDDDIWFAKDINHDGDLLDAGEGIGRWASNGTPGSEFTGLYFDKFNANVAYVNIQHPNTGVDRLIQISAVPEPESYAMFLAGLGLVGFAARRRAAK